jgi:hypothetical protein
MSFSSSGQTRSVIAVIDRDFARRLVSEHIEEGCQTKDGFTPVILDDKTIERAFGWVFFYQSREYLDTGDLGFRMLGNAPLIVDRSDGSIHVTGTAEPIEHYIKEYEDKRGST